MRSILVTIVFIFFGSLFGYSQFNSDSDSPTVVLSDSDSDNIVTNSDVVTITATFSESMAATPTISLSGITSNALMSASSSDSVWSYTWTVSTSVSSVTATVSGTDLAGNSYNGSDILIFMMAEEDLVFHYDASNPLSYNQQTTSASNNTIIDLSGNGNDGFIDVFDHVFYDSSEDAFYFNGYTKRDGKGLFIKNVNYISGNSDQINELTLEARVKLKSDITNHDNDERIILSFDRSSVFRWGIGSDQNNQSSGKLSFAFANSEGTHDIYDSGFNSDLRDDQWHDIKILFKANQANGLKFYVDNQLTYTDPTVYSPIGNHNENQSPRYGVVGNGNEMTTQGGSTHPDNMFYGWIKSIKYYAKSLPSVTLSSTVSTLEVSNSSVVTITATFSKSMKSTPTLSLSGIVNDAEMIATASDSIWTYLWTVSGSTVSSTTATVSGTDLSGNPYSGTESITFTIDNTPPTVTLTDTDSDNLVSNSDVVTITATFSESMAVTPTISLSGITSNALMSATSSDSVWSYTWTVSTSVSSVTATVSGTDLLGNAYSGTDSITFIVDNTPPTVTLTDTDSDNVVSDSDEVTITATFSESMAATPTISLSGITSNALMVATDSDSVWSYTWTVFTSVSSVTATVSGTDLLGNAYSGTVSITFGIRSIPDYMIGDGLVAWYPFNGNSNDESGGLNNSLNTGAILTIDRKGESNKAYLFDGLDDYLEVPEDSVSDDINNLVNAITISAWFMLSGENSDNTWQRIISRRNFTSNPTGERHHFDLGVKTNGNIVFSSYNNANLDDYGMQVYNTKNNFDINKWNHIVITFDSDENGSLKTYLNGVLVNEGNYPEYSLYSFSHWINIGNVRRKAGNPLFGFFNGKLDDIGIWSKALSQEEILQIYNDTTPPTVTLTDTDSDNLVSKSDVVTITATFSESMAATPTISLSGITSNALMSATSSDSVWTYSWIVSGTTVDSTTATISGTDISGNSYAGTDSITFTIDSSAPTLVSFTDNDSNNYVNQYTNITLSATFSEAMADTPTVSISGLVTNTAMTVSASTNSTTWTYLWDVPAGNDGVVTATVSGTDIIGNPYTGTESISFVIDNTSPLIQSVTVTDTNSKVILTYSEAVELYDPTYFVSNFTVSKSGGNATVNYTGYSFSSTDSNTIILDIDVTGDTTGDELLQVGPTGASTIIDQAGNYALDYSNSNQTSNTVYLTNSPPNITSTSVSSNNTSVTVVFNETVAADANGTSLSAADFSLSVSGGSAILASATPDNITTTDNTTFILSVSYTEPADGSEILTVTPVNSGIYDLKGEQINMSSLQSNTTALNDKQGPIILTATIAPQNSYVDITFSEGVYGTVSPSTAVTSPSFTLSQQSGPSYVMSITSITTTTEGNLSGGEATLRFNLDAAGIKPTGQEIFAITATDSSSVMDISGNSMTVSQTNNTFQLKPPTSGGVSPEKSIISITPTEMIANGINTAIISVQAKDSLGQNFLEGGYQVKIFGPEGDLVTVDNQNGTYSANYTPEEITQNQLDVPFGFRVVETSATASVVLKLHLDEDGDGVYNSDDLCPATEQGLEVDETGCALNQIDTDEDGVTDDIDRCLNTPKQEFNNVPGSFGYGTIMESVIDEFGCSTSQKDTDLDGIFDNEDNCITTPNQDQADQDGDGIGDVCDTDNALPELQNNTITFAEQPENGKIIGTVRASDPDGETLTFTIDDNTFDGILQIDSATGQITVVEGQALTMEAYNGVTLPIIVSDGTNSVRVSVTLKLLPTPEPPVINVVTFELSEDAPVGTLAGLVEAYDPMDETIPVTLSFLGAGYFELVNNTEIRTTRELDYETAPAIEVIFQAVGVELSSTKYTTIQIADIPNATYTGRFFISVFDLFSETVASKVDYTRYLNPAYTNRGVGKWKVKKRVSGGRDAALFEIKEPEGAQKVNDEDLSDDGSYLDFINPPDFENPQDFDKDNVYEVEVTYVNEEDGSTLVPVPVTQFQLQVPENSKTAIELQSVAKEPTEDTDGDGIADIIDNAPLVANADQTDEDGDGIGDVSDDFDHDGVFNPYDTCPDTPLGSVVDANGCVIYYLPPDNFTLFKTEKCAGTNAITVEVLDTSVTYHVEVSGAIQASDNFSGPSWTLDSLSAGTYSLCFTVPGVSALEFERCFEVTITEPDPLSVYTTMSSDLNTLLLNLNGGQIYNINHNGVTTQTSKSNYNVKLKKGYNRVRVTTGIECQGIFEHEYFVSSDVRVAPNPFTDQVVIYVGGDDTEVDLNVFSSQGVLIHAEQCDLSPFDRTLSLQTGNYPQGSYIIKVTGQTTNKSITVIKE